jgi:hypothetical protein
MRSSGKLGFGRNVQTAPGVWDDVITERDYVGDVIQRTEVLAQSDTVLPQYRTTTSISVLSGGVDKQNYSDLRYVTYAGVHWKIASAVLQWPRVVIYIGEEYRGPLPTPAP